MNLQDPPLLFDLCGPSYGDLLFFIYISRLEWIHSGVFEHLAKNVLLVTSSDNSIHFFAFMDSPAGEGEAGFASVELVYSGEFKEDETVREMATLDLSDTDFAFSVTLQGISPFLQAGKSISYSYSSPFL